MSGGPKLGGMPEQWTLLEAVAWISLRDLAAVRDVSPHTERRSIRYRMAEDTGAIRSRADPQRWIETEAISVHDLSLVETKWNHLQASGERPLGPPTGAAMRDIHARLMAGDIKATGQIQDMPRRESIAAAAWRFLCLVPRGRAVEADAMAPSARQWRNLAVLSSDVLALWPPEETAAPGSSASSDSYKRAVFFWKANAASTAKYGDLIRKCMRETACSRDEAARAKIDVQGGRRQGRTKTPRELSEEVREE